jgi:hypothetical protein
MKKILEKSIYTFLLKVFIFCIPLISLGVIFWMFEPYNYWGIRSKNYRIEDNPVTIVRDYREHPSVNILLSDSRLAAVKIDPAILGKEVYNFAYGGATMTECIKLFWFAADQYKLENVFFQLSFYSLNGNHNTGLDRISDIIDSSKNPIKYMTNTGMLRGAARNIINILKQRQQDEFDYHNQKLLSEDDFHNYAIKIKEYCMTYQISEQYLRELEEIADYCQENNINLIFFTPLLHYSIWRYVIDPLGIDNEIHSYKERLSQKTIIRDMEYLSPISYRDNDFSDGMHFRNETRDEFVKTILTGIGDNYELWE